ncbi:head-tail connector protein [Paracoccus sp. SSK6]|uniref:head-tail connector protein n=1 Tax=Paracoccus sp. SSK6 TaxID=3143131 RepID=UPI00321A955A
MIVGAADLQRHLRASDDQLMLVQTIGEAAEVQVRHWIGRPFYEKTQDLPQPGDPEYDPMQIVADGAIKVAIMKIAFTLYWSRGGNGDVVAPAVPPADVQALLAGHRVFARTCDDGQ